MNYKIGTRGSKLALAQADLVRTRLQEAYPEDTFELKVIRTKGDQLKDVPLGKIGDKGIFVREIEEQILEGKIQLGVHSMKDMPSQPALGLVFAKAWKREDARDVLILRKEKSLSDLPEGAVIGTGSMRRKFQLLAMRRNIQIVDIFWDRMYLHIVLEGAKLEDHTYVIATKKNKYMYPLEFDQATNSIIINITNIKDKEMLSNSRWYIKYENKYFEQEMEVYNTALEIWEKEVVDRPELQSAKPWIPYQWNDIPITVEVGYKLKKADKVFRYGGMSYAYVVTFSTQELRNQLVCCLTSTFMVKNTNPKKRRFKSEASQLKKRMKKRLIYLKEAMMYPSM